MELEAECRSRTWLMPDPEAVLYLATVFSQFLVNDFKALPDYFAPAIAATHR